MSRTFPMTLALSCLCLSSLSAGIALAKRLPETAALQRMATVEEPSFWRGKTRVSAETGAALFMADLRHKVAPGTPEQRARDFLAARSATLGLRDAAGQDLRLHAVRESKSGTTVRFQQYVGEIPVYGARIAVTFNHDGEVRTVASTYRPRVRPVESALLVSEAAATAVALGYFGVDEAAATAAPAAREAKVVRQIDYLRGRTHLTHQVDFDGPGPLHGWRILVDAVSGEVLRAVDRNHYVDGSGRVFVPDPLSSAVATYGDPGFTDGGDADTPEMTAESPMRALLDLTENAGTFFFTGPWAEVVDWDSPFKGDFSQNSSTWDFTRQNDAFEAANTYFHIDAYMRYLNVTLGVDVRPYQYATGVQFDPSGFSGADNSSYSSGSGRLRFGEGGVDDAEDADVVIHELGHGLHDWVTSGGLSQNQGLSEGVGDFAAVSYSRGFAGQWAPSDPQYNWTFSWDGHNQFWGGRVTNWNDLRDYPSGLTGSIHTDGQFWASCNIDIYEQIGADKSTAAHWEGLGRTGGGSNQSDAAQAVLDAATDMGFSVSDLQIMFDVFDDCGYTVTVDLGTIFVDGFESGGVGAWGQSQ